MTPKAARRETLEDEAKRNGFSDVKEFWTSENNPFLARPTRLRSLVTSVSSSITIRLLKVPISILRCGSSWW